MSLNKEQRRVTSDELKVNLAESHLSLKDVAAYLKIDMKEMDHVIHLKSSMIQSPAKLQDLMHNVWDARDYINRHLIDEGKTPLPYTYLKGEKTYYWFLRDR